MTDKDFDGASGDKIDLQALFGDDWEAATTDPDDESGSGADVSDISAADQQSLRGLFAADVSDAPDSAVTVESILAAARAAAAPKAAAPNTDYKDELAKRRRLKIGKGLLAAAAVAAVVVGAATLLRGNGVGGTSNSGSAALAASGPSPSRVHDLASGNAAAGGASSAVARASADAPSAGSSFAAAGSSAAGTGAASGPAGGAGRSGAASVSASAAGSAAAASSAGDASSLGSGSKHPATAPASSGGTLAGGRAASGSSSGASSQVPEAATCGWPQLPPGADAQAKAILGGVVGPHRSLTDQCLPNRLQGGSFPAIDHPRLAVTVEVTKHAAGIHSCLTQGCVPIGGRAYATQTPVSTTIRLDAAGHQVVVVRAPAGLNIPRDQLLAFAKAIDKLTS